MLGRRIAYWCGSVACSAGWTAAVCGSVLAHWRAATCIDPQTAPTLRDALYDAVDRMEDRAQGTMPTGPPHSARDQPTLHA